MPAYIFERTICTAGRNIYANFLKVSCQYAESRTQAGLKWKVYNVSDLTFSMIARDSLFFVCNKKQSDLAFKLIMKMVSKIKRIGQPFTSYNLSVFWNG